MLCPVCGTTLSAVERNADCAHVVARMGESGFWSPLDGLALPWLSGRAVRRRWSGYHVAEAFGELAPLIDAYGAVADWRPGLSARVLWPLLADVLDEPVAEVTPGSGEAAERVWCTARPEAVAEEARALAGLLAQGYTYLTHLSRQTQPAAAAA